MKELPLKRRKPAGTQPELQFVPLAEACQQAMRLMIGTESGSASVYEKFSALALALRERLMAQWRRTEQNFRQSNAKRIHFLSPEYLIGRTLQNALINLDLEEDARAMLHTMGVTNEEVYENEYDALLGNGGLARLSACFLDSMATLGLPASGYGLRYEYGLFNQKIVDGHQVECPEFWLMHGNPWEICCQEQPIRIRFNGNARQTIDPNGRNRGMWTDYEEVYAIACRILIPGYRNGVVNPLTLWRAMPTPEFPDVICRENDYLHSLYLKHAGELVSRILYPGAQTEGGRELRLKQEYFMAAASLQTILREFLANNSDLSRLPEKVAIHINDTHHAVAIPELMRLLIDEYSFPWETAWDVTTKTFAFTSHSLLPESLDRWEIPLFSRILPRHMEIVFEINRRFLDRIRALCNNDPARIRTMSLIDEDGDKKVRMGNLAAIGCHSISGVSKFHTRMLTTRLWSDFHDLWPEKFKTRTNGITPRRWLFQANPALSQLITEAIGDGWIRNLDELRNLERFSDDSGFIDTWIDVKRHNKQSLADYCARKLSYDLSTAMLFDVQCTRFTPAKRQLLNLLHLVARYQRILDRPGGPLVPRVVVLAGKATPGDLFSKLVIKLTSDIAKMVNNDPQARSHLQVIFVPNYRVSLAERIFPATDLAEQLAFPALEPCGTGSMKASINGALIIGSQSGANLEIRSAVGAENIFTFGLTETEASARRTTGYDPRVILDRNQELKRVVAKIFDGFFADGDTARHQPVVRHLLDEGDPYMILADFASYIESQNAVDTMYQSPVTWARTAIRNVSRMGYFSSDRTVREYADEVWHVQPVNPVAK